MRKSLLSDFYNTNIQINKMRCC